MSEPGRRRGRPPRLLSGDTAARILDTARTLFAEHGFTVTTNRMVADAAGVTPTALYHYHASKLDLYAAVHDECRDRLARRMAAAVTDADTFVDRLIAVLDTTQQLANEDPSLARFLASAHVDMARQADVQATVHGGSMWLSELVAGVVEAGVATGELGTAERAGANALLVALLMGLTDAASIDPDLHNRAITASRNALRGWVLARQLAGG